MLQRASDRAHVSAAAVWVIASLFVGLVSSTAHADETTTGPAPPGATLPEEQDPLGEVRAGSLFWNHPRARLPLPMLDLRVEIAISGIMVHGTVLQTFENPTGEVIEALYAFPLPERAAVHHMEIRIGERRIVSVIQERQQARLTYAAARSEGRKAALLEQNRPNLFTTTVANINPGESIRVRLEYVEELAYDGGAFSLVFPLAYTHRYSPPGPAGRGDPPGLRDTGPGGPPPAATLEVRLNAGLPLEEVGSDSHDVTTWWDGEVLVIEPRAGSIPADRDFHLRFRPLVGWEPASAVLTEDRPDGRYALLMILPPAGENSVGLATDTLFIVDVSGSMAGPSLAQAKEALLAALDRLRPDDTFNILAFNEDVRAFAGGYVPAHATEIAWGRQWVDGLRAGGGTRIDLALERGLALIAGAPVHRAERIVFLTDGAVSNEDAILQRVSSALGATRLHVLGIGAAPNRYLMSNLAAAGRGLCGFISRVERAENRIDAFLARLDRPVMTDLRLTWSGEQPLEVWPEQLPDLHAGEPLYLSVRFRSGAAPARLSFEGRLAGGSLLQEMDLNAGPERATGIATRWARAKVAALTDRLHRGGDTAAVRTEVIDVSKRFRIVTRYTSLVAVEAFPTAGEDARLVRIAGGLPGSGQLPFGGTHGPLHRLAGLLLAAAGGIAWLLRRVW